jgi:hypothetical protein
MPISFVSTLGQHHAPRVLTVVWLTGSVEDLEVSAVRSSVSGFSEDVVAVGITCVVAPDRNRSHPVKVGSPAADMAYVLGETTAEATSRNNRTKESVHEIVSR